MSHRLVGTNRYAKPTATGGCDGVDHSEVTNFKQPPPYLKGKVKSISENDLGKSMRHPLSSSSPSSQRVENCDFDPNNQQARNRKRLLPPTPDTAPAQNDTTHQPSSSSEDFAKLVLEKQHRNKQALIIGRNKNNNNDQGIGPPGHKPR